MRRRPSAEAVFAQFKRELIYRCKIDTRQAAKRRVEQYFVALFNPLRHETLRRKHMENIAAMDVDESDALKWQES